MRRPPYTQFAWFSGAGGSVYYPPCCFDLLQPYERAASHRCSADDLKASGLLDADPPPQIVALPGPMFRVIDLLQTLEALRPNFAGLKGQVTLVMDDALAPSGTPLAVTIEGDGAAVDVRPATDRDNYRRRIEGDVRVWSSVLVGGCSLADALALHRLRAYSEAAAALAAPLFPRRDPFIPVPDHF